MNRLPVSWQSFVADEESYLGKWLFGAKPICSFRPFPQDSVICVLIMLMSKYASTVLLSICFQNQHVLGKCLFSKFPGCVACPLKVYCLSGPADPSLQKKYSQPLTDVRGQEDPLLPENGLQRRICSLPRPPKCGLNANLKELPSDFQETQVV